MKGYYLGGRRAVREIRRAHPGLTPWAWRMLPKPPDGFLFRWPYKGEQFDHMKIDAIHSVAVAHRASSWGRVTHLQIRRHDLSPTISWAALQRIKNELCGEESLAIHIHPPESQLVDEMNIYHLWVLPPGFIVPFGLHGPVVSR